jgi:hypothetical protein
VFDEVNIHEYPAFADLRAGDFSGASFLLQRHRMDVQEGSRCLQIERIHGATPLGECCDDALTPQVHRGNLLAAVAHLVADLLSSFAIDGLLLWRELLRRWPTARRALPARHFLVAGLRV